MNTFGNNGYSQSYRWRINILQGIIVLLVLAIVGRLFYVQVLAHDYYWQIGLQQRAVVQDLRPERGNIYALTDYKSQELYPLAVNEIYYEVSVNPSKITRPQNVSDLFVEHLAVDKEVALEKVKQEAKQYELIAKKASRESTESLLQALDILRQDINQSMPADKQLKTVSEMGVDFVKHVLRYYPDKEVGAHILGFLGFGDDGYSRVGKYGLEGYLENDLAGIEGILLGETDVTGTLLANRSSQPATNGADIILTIDRTVQYKACKELEKAVAETEAESGTVVILDTQTGAIQAMCNYPSFDPNNYGQVDSSGVYNNSAVYEAYEPGSVMKVISMAIAIDQGKVTPNTTYVDEGEIKFAGDKVIRNAGNKKYGLVDMKQVLADSINTGVVYATHDINNKIFEDYVQNFGFGKEIGLNISQISSGDIALLSKPGDIYKATGSYGQGLTVTPLQMAAAVNVIANDGQFTRPYLVSRIQYPDGTTKDFGPQVERQVITQSTAAQVSAMMVNTVDVGHSARAGVAGYFVAGKTGTAQVANPETGKYYTDRTIHTFVGFAPNNAPRFTMLTKLNYPKTAPYAESTAAPLFGQIASFLLEYYQIPPDR